MKEFPASEGEPYYPILNEANISIAKKYMEQAKKDNVILSGRLATYSYLNMDLVVKQSLELFDKYFL